YRQAVVKIHRLPVFHPAKFNLAILPFIAWIIGRNDPHGEMGATDREIRFAFPIRQLWNRSEEPFELRVRERCCLRWALSVVVLLESLEASIGQQGPIAFNVLRLACRPHLPSLRLCFRNRLSWNTACTNVHAIRLF